MKKFSLVPKGPFNLSHQRDYFGGFPSLQSDPSATVLAFPVEGWKTSAAVVLRQSADGAINGDIYGCDDAETKTLTKIQSQALATFSLDTDATHWPDVGARDSVIGALQKRYQFVRPTLFYSPYEAAAHFIIGHRISMKQGRSIRLRIANDIGEKISVGEQNFSAFPAPQVILSLQSIQSLPALKMERLKGIAQAALDGLLDRDSLRSSPPKDAIERLKQLAGVGPFFAQGILNRGAGLVDEITDDDLTKYAIKMAYKLKTLPNQKEVLKIAKNWRPFRMWTVVLLHIWLRREVGLPKRKFKK